MENHIEDHILALLEKHNKDSLSISQLGNRISAARWSRLGLKKTSPPSEMLKALQPFLGKKLRQYQGSRSVHIGLDIPPEEMILCKIRQYDRISVKKLGSFLPIPKTEYIGALNRLLESGAVICVIGKNDMVFVRTLPDKAESEQDMPRSDDRDAFESAYRKIGKGRGFVRIHLLREELGWTKERFDTVLRNLMADYTIELHGGDPTVLNEQQIRDSFTDEKGTLYITLTWWGKR